MISETTFDCARRRDEFGIPAFNADAHGTRLPARAKKAGNISHERKAQ
jgi:hypothetical protein